jgi:aminopeptidase N
VVSGAAAKVAADPTRCAPWAFMNAGAHGYFRSAYSTGVIHAIAPDLGTRLAAPERLSLVADEWALVKAGRHPVGEYLTIVSGLRDERVSGVLGEVTAALAFVGDYLTTGQTRPRFEQFVQILLRPLFNELGVSAAVADNDDRRALRAVVIAALGATGGDRDVAGKAREVLDRALAGTAPLDSTAADAIIRVAAKHGDAALYDALSAAARRATSPSDRYRYLYALAAFEDPALVQRGLEFALSPELRSQDTATYLGRFLANPATSTRAWAFTKQHWTRLAPKLSISLGDVRLVQSLQSFCDPRTRDDIRSFFATHRLSAASRTLDQTLEHINNCIALKEKQTPALTDWSGRQGR